MHNMGAEARAGVVSKVLGILALIPAAEIALFFLLAHWWGYGSAFTISWLSWLVGIGIAFVGIRRWWLGRQARWRQGTVDLVDAPDLLGVMVAALLLIMPGPGTGLAGALLMIDPVRAWLWRVTARHAARRLTRRQR